MMTRPPPDLLRTSSVIAGIGLLSFLIVVTFFPGVMTKDSEAALDQARSLELTDWHPPIMALIWRYLDAIIRGPLLMLVSQALLYAWAVTKLCREGFPRINRLAPAWVTVLAFGLFPPAMALIGMIWKDVWMSGLLLLGLGYLYGITTVTTSAERLRAFASLVVCCLLATAFRHNAVSATAGLLAGGCYFLLPTRDGYLKLLLSCLGGLVIAFALWLANGILVRSVASPTHPTTSILLHDIAGIITNSSDPQDEAAYFLTSHSKVSSRPHAQFMRQLERSYRPSDANGVLRSSRRTNVPFDIVVYDRDHDAAAVRSAWGDLLARNLRAYLAHRLDTFLCLLQLCDIEAWANHSYVLNPSYLGTESSSAAQAKLRHIFLERRLVRLYSPAWWLAVSLVVGAGSLVLGRGRGKVPFFMGLSGLGLSVALFFTAPIESYRYMHWVILLGWTCVFVMMERVLSRMAHRAETARNSAYDERASV
ncbi:hypothetical protein QFW77_08280 [Luteimonas sp. RD2P54]|uniref:Uncharacterized protein n=1 Tax=Luteimonas endophytica TaxID=3042023 RepID=A0ABT6J838_9GAMM|nr:hypothetical protein [Luteimonas endophytica]MDH5822985.1 hypothetical protein [Luteimonas endophytica]